MNINGFSTYSISQQRGLRQGDPLSPLLFNLALEPLLLSILQDARIKGFQFHGINFDGHSIERSPTIELLAYADDVCLLLKDPHDFTLVHDHMQKYTMVSNAKFNVDKTKAFSLNGKRDPSWTSLLTSNNISIYHYLGSTSPFRYLGFYLPYSTAQRRTLEDQLLLTVKTQSQIYSQRQLSIMGRVTVMNILILSKIWYTLRLLKPTQRFFQRLRSIIYQFVWQKKHPSLRKDKSFFPGMLVV